MCEHVHSAPIPIRLRCGCSNGAVVSYLARALAFDDSSMRILSSENFEKGVQLDVMAPFLEATVSCRVPETSRSQAQPAYFELDLRLLRKSPPVAQPKTDSSPGGAAPAHFRRGYSSRS